MRLRIKYDFMRLAPASLAAFAGSVGGKMKDNPNFPEPEVDPDDIISGAALLMTRIEEAQQGGILPRTLRNQQQVMVQDILRKQAAYVQSVVADDLAKLQSSGFDVTSSNRARAQLPQPLIRRIFTPVSKVLAVQVLAIRNARAFEVRVHNGTEEWFNFGGFTSSRTLLIPGRVPGQLYTIQVRAIGGLTGYSDWSDPVTHMAT